MITQLSNDILRPEELSLTEAARKAQMTRAGLWHNIKTNKLVARKVGCQFVIRTADLYRWMQETGRRTP